MRVLLDECLPKRLKIDLKEGHEVSTVQEMGWKSIVNGELLRRANKAGFDVFLTADKSIPHQQNLGLLRLSVIVMPTNQKDRVRESVPALLELLGRIRPGECELLVV
uniref:DUF5615 domain-containing protein n=1 Tax=Candidatus Kentrum sp. DK TaxID=2126562 RepID=A0A450TJI3_9GAMM|nr:MAG: hypothetical protein BECKDK2373C_GA0170839_11663 [Candidatus Kentron sp. DK]